MFLCKTQLQKKPRTPIKAPEIGNIQSPHGNSGSLSKSYIWANPSSPRASQLRHKSNDSRYASLVKVAEHLNSCSPIESDVFEALKGLGDNILEQDAVVVLNNMNNLENALLALNYFQQRLKPKREVVLCNVTLKVCGKGKDMERAEKLYLRIFFSCDEILQRGTPSVSISLYLRRKLRRKNGTPRVPNFSENRVEVEDLCPTFPSTLILVVRLVFCIEIYFFLVMFNVVLQHG